MCSKHYLQESTNEAGKIFRYLKERVSLFYAIESHWMKLQPIPKGDR